MTHPALSDWWPEDAELKVAPRLAQSASVPPADPTRANAMPRFTVHIRDEWLAVPCRDTSCTIQWLGLEALKRYVKNKPDNGGIKSVKETHFLVRKCQGSGLLDADDTIEDVLDDNDFVELGKACVPGYNPTTPCA